MKIKNKRNKKVCHKSCFGWSWKKSKRIHKNNKLILKSQQRFRSKQHNVFTEEVKKIALDANDDKRI